MVNASMALVYVTRHFRDLTARKPLAKTTAPTTLPTALTVHVWLTSLATTVPATKQT